MKQALLLGLALGLATSHANGDPAVEARFFDDLARRSFAAGKYDEALRDFLLAHSVAPSPRSLYNIALCGELLHNSGVAFSYYREYLGSNDADDERRARATARFEKLKASLALIEVESVPPGARIFADRVELGSLGTTPTLIAVAPGEHQLMLERDGFLTAMVPSSALTGTVGKVSASLTPRLGEVAVRVSPPHAKLELLKDGAPALVSDKPGYFELQVGSYVVRASAPGYLPTEAQIVIHEGSREQLDIAATPLPKATGRLLVASPDVAGDVLVDGVRVAMTPTVLPNLSVGSHAIEVRARGRSFKRQVTVREGRTSYLEAQWGNAKR